MANTLANTLSTQPAKPLEMQVDIGCCYANQRQGLGIDALGAVTGWRRIHRRICGLLWLVMVAPVAIRSVASNVLLKTFLP